MSAEAPAEIELHEDDLQQTECGILVICRPAAPIDIQEDLIHRLLKGGNELQHRGEQSSGLVIHGTTRLTEERGLGRLNDVVDPQSLATIHGDAYAGAVHLRWTTNGSTEYGNVQPVPVDLGDYRIAHFMVNGNTPGADQLRALLPYELDPHASDSVIMAHVMAHAPGSSLAEKFQWLLEQPVVKNSAYCAVAMSGDTVVAARDRFGLHPLVLGEIEDEQGPIYTIASEDSAIRKIGGRVIRSLAPGETLQITKDGIQVIDDGVDDAIPAECIFERLYFMDAGSRDVLSGTPDSEWRTIAYKRYQLGVSMAAELKRELDDIDFLCDSPNSGRWFTAGLHNASGRPLLPIIQRIVSSRSFTQGADANTTERKVRDKLEFLEESAFIEGAHIGIGDDSLIHGNTARTIIRILKNLGARGVSFFVSMPQVVDACHLGVNLKNRDEMIANICDGDPDLIAWAIDAVHVHFAKHELVIQAIKDTDDIVIPPQYNGDNPDALYLANGLCPGCVTGKHIVDKHGHLEHFIPLIPA